MEKEKVLISAFVALESAHFFSAFLPSVFTIKTFVKQTDGEKAIREGELYAILFALALGLVVSNLIKSYLPLIASIIVAVAILIVYEKSLKSS